MRNGWDDVAEPHLFTGFQALHQTSSPCRNASLSSISQGSLPYGNAVSIVGNLIIHHRPPRNRRFSFVGRHNKNGQLYITRLYKLRFTAKRFQLMYSTADLFYRAILLHAIQCIARLNAFRYFLSLYAIQSIANLSFWSLRGRYMLYTLLKHLSFCIAKS